jgi:hypothetical protein
MKPTQRLCLLLWTRLWAEPSSHALPYHTSCSHTLTRCLRSPSSFQPLGVGFASTPAGPQARQPVSTPCQEKGSQLPLHKRRSEKVLVAKGAPPGTHELPGVHPGWSDPTDHPALAYNTRRRLLRWTPIRNDGSGFVKGLWESNPRCGPGRLASSIVRQFQLNSARFHLPHEQIVEAH